MNNKKNLSIIILAVILVLLLVLVVALKSYQPVNPGNTNPSSVKNGASGINSSNNPSASSQISSSTPISPLSVMPGSPEAPKPETVAADKIPVSAINIKISASGFSPDKFIVQAGQPVSLALTSTDNNTHVFVFPNASLMALTVMVRGGETKIIKFNAPATGSYTFRDDIPSYRNNTGIMIVK